MENKEEQKNDFWNDHSLKFLEMAFKRDFQERVETCDGFGEKVRSCGDTIRFYLMVDQNRVAAISYDIEGCLFSHACANALIHLSAGKDLDEALKISPREIVDFLETLPENEIHCAQNAVAAFGAAVADYRSARR